MDQPEFVVRCPNCGGTFPPEPLPRGNPARGLRHRCPVCQFRFTTEAPSSLASVEDLESGISALVSQARAGGVTPAEIVQVLRDELAFMAEFANRGRHLCVQIIDLGPQEDVLVDQLQPDSREALLSRGHVASGIS